ncbi:MAG: hypothetical protein ACLPVJ_01310, partial [Syntrophobacteraceae bacterium]
PEGIPRTPDADPHLVSGPRYTHRHRPYVQSAPDLSVRADPHFVSGPRYTHRHRPYVQSAPDLSVRADDRRAMRSPSALREVHR